MKVAFVSGNREQLPDAVIPLGLLYVMANTPDPHEKRLIDLCFEDAPIEALARSLEDFAPDVVALGMRNIQYADYTGRSDTLAWYDEIMATARAVTSAPIVLGGSGFSVMPGDLMARLRPDYGIAGEAEEAFPALLEAIGAGSGFERVAGLHRLDAGPPTARPAFLDLNGIQGPDRGLVDRRYYSDFGTDSLQTKRGCPLHCDYCTYPIIEGRVGRTREPARVVDEYLSTAEAGGNHVFVVDSVFNLPVGHAKSICREMIDRGPGLPWSCYVNPLGFDEELAELMSQAGCAGMEVGADSGVDSVLERLRKGFDTQKIRDLHRLAEAAGVPDCHTFILGTPGETLDDVRRTLDFIVDLDPFSTIVMVWTDDTDAVNPERALERRALREQVLAVLEEHRQDFPWWSIPEIGVNHDAKLFATLRRHGNHGPLWQHIRRMLPAPRRTQSPERKKGVVITR
jgi:radical SAM superfamily enzyme YgiQ (UPF0313 family)